MAATGARATAPTIRAPCGPGCWARSSRRTQRSTTIRRWRARSSTPLADALDGYAVGTLGEIFDGDAPPAPGGTIAQAWSVGELIAALRLVG